MIRPWAILPVKEMAGAKQRLAALLSPEERIALMRVMVEDVVAALCGASGLAGIALVTLDPWASELAARHRLRVITEGARDGHTGSVIPTEGRSGCQGDGHTCSVIPTKGRS